MAETLTPAHAGSGKAEQYKNIIPQLIALTSAEPDLTANLANLSAALKETFQWWWVGFYIVRNTQLVLGPFQGPIACTRIAQGKGVCGSAWKNKKTILVPDVEKFPGHIACSSLSVSEIVVPIFDKEGEVVAVLDVDSERYDVLDETDMNYLDELCNYIGTLFEKE